MSAMHGSDHSGAARNVPNVPKERREAANVLRMAGRSNAGLDEQLQWLFARMPMCLPARRIIIDRLIGQGDIGGAEAVILQGILQHPSHPSLLFLLARCQYERGDFLTARQTIERVIQARPFHVRTRALAARIAMAEGRPQHAVVHCDRARRRRRCAEEINGLFVDALLATRAYARAELVLQEQHAPDPLRLARLRMGQDRLIDARRILDRALAQPNLAAERATELQHLMLDVSDRLEDRESILAAVEAFSGSAPSLQLRRAMSLLRCSAWTKAIRLAFPLRRHRSLGGRALTVLLVAATNAGRDRLADRATAWLLKRTDRPNAVETAEIWLAAHLGWVLNHRMACESPAQGEPPSILQGLLSDAMQTLSEAAPDPRPVGSARITEARRQELLQLCRTTLASSTSMGGPIDVRSQAA